MCVCVYQNNNHIEHVHLLQQKKRQILDFQWNKQTKKIEINKNKLSIQICFFFFASFYFFWRGKIFYCSISTDITVFLHLHPTTRTHIHTQFYWRECDLVPVKKKHWFCMESEGIRSKKKVNIFFLPLTLLLDLMHENLRGVLRIRGGRREEKKVMT